MSAFFVARFLISSMILSIIGSTCASTPSFSIRACDKLFMSSEVQEKCTYSSIGLSSSRSPSFCFTKYSTDLTSCFVIASVRFTASASSTSKFSTRESRYACVSALKGGTSAMSAHWDKCCIHLISTSTRLLMRPYSLKTPRRPLTFDAYLPSRGPTAVSSDSWMSCSFPSPPLFLFPLGALFESAFGLILVLNAQSLLLNFGRDTVLEVRVELKEGKEGKEG
mmetsp:Transcript_7868/g.14690  ORF Transcript_7868/g.14690 Transcript_7868/m.14690 type:complete len:223 (+) Transcript_7868:2130-2798(+)